MPTQSDHDDCKSKMLFVPLPGNQLRSVSRPQCDQMKRKIWHGGGLTSSLCKSLLESKELGKKKIQLACGTLLGRSSALAETLTFNRRVVGSSPALAAT